VGAFLLAFAALFAGVGILYLIRHGGLGFGAKIHNALPLEQLAGQDSQPFSHMAIAWIPAGFVAGLAFFSLTRFGVLARTAVLTARGRQPAARRRGLRFNRRQRPALTAPGAAAHQGSDLDRGRPVRARLALRRVAAAPAPGRG
jgi:hypothetical protein